MGNIIWWYKGWMFLKLIWCFAFKYWYFSWNSLVLYSLIVTDLSVILKNLIKSPLAQQLLFSSWLNNFGCSIMENSIILMFFRISAAFKYFWKENKIEIGKYSEILELFWSFYSYELWLRFYCEFIDFLALEISFELFLCFQVFQFFSWSFLGCIRFWWISMKIRLSFALFQDFLQIGFIETLIFW